MAAITSGSYYVYLAQYNAVQDNNIFGHLEGKIGHKNTHNDLQNELLDIVAVLSFQYKLNLIGECKLFSIITDEGTDANLEISNFMVTKRKLRTKQVQGT